MSILSNENTNHLYYTLKNIIESKLGYFPEIGIIAGQSVASALLEHLKLNKNHNMPFNDIDLFINENDAPYCEEIDLDKPEIDEDGNIITYKTEQSKLIRSGEKGHLNFYSVYNSYTCELFDPTHKNGYKIIYSHRDLNNEKLNYVRIDMMDTRQGGQMSPMPFMAGRGIDVLAGFDINACQIALDPAQKKVVWTNEFEEFINTLELKASFLGTPMHTAVRLLKKHDEIPFLKFNEEKEMLLLQSARQVFVQMENQRELHDGKGYGFMPGNLFSNAYLPKIDRYWETLAKYFKLNKKTCVFNNSYSVKKTNSDLSEHRTEKVEKTFYAFTPLDYDHASVSSFCHAFIKGQQRPSCEDVNRLFMIWFDASKRTHKIREAAAVIPTNLKEERFSSTWLRLNINDHFNALDAVHNHEYRYAFQTYSNHPELFSRFVTDKESMLTIIKRASNIEWAERSGFGYYLSMFSAPSTFHLMPSKEKMPYEDMSGNNKSVEALKEAIKAHYVPFDADDFKEQLYKAQDKFLESLKEIRSPFIENDECQASQFSTELVSSNFIHDACALFIALYYDNAFINNDHFCGGDLSWDAMCNFAFGHNVFLHLSETKGIKNSVLLRFNSIHADGQFFHDVFKELSKHIPSRYCMESLLLTSRNLSPALKERGDQIYSVFAA